MPTSDVQVTPARQRDYEWCARLMASCEPWLTLGRGLEECRARCADPEYLLLMAHAGTMPVGFCLVHPRGLAGSPYVASIAVDPPWRGRGIGTVLLAYVDLHFPSARDMFLCVSSFNARARAFYERLGFTVVGELDDYLIDGASEMLMRKRLTRA